MGRADKSLSCGTGDFPPGPSGDSLDMGERGGEILILLMFLFCCAMAATASSERPKAGGGVEEESAIPRNRASFWALFMA